MPRTLNISLLSDVDPVSTVLGIAFPVVKINAFGTRCFDTSGWMIRMASGM